MKKLQLLTTTILLLSIMSACEKDKATDMVLSATTTENIQQEPLELTEDILKVFKSNFYNVDNVSIVDFMLPDGTIEQRYQLESDILFSAEQFKSLSEIDTKSAKNYHTTNLVSPRTLSIVGYTGGQNALSSKERTALQYAVNNYNALNLSIRFSLTFSSSYQNRDMVVYYNPNESGAGGSAGFPSNGNPNKFIQIYGLNNYDVNVIEHVITHEIGHSVGFRHTDWFSRQSCGQNVNEGTSGVGAIPIPGTPSAYDPTSIMLACFSANEDGEFNNNDIIALNYLY